MRSFVRFLSAAFLLPALLSAVLCAQTPAPRAIGASALDSTDAVRRVVAAAVSAGAHTVVVNVPLYAIPDGGFDGITALIRAAHDRGLSVNASIATNVVADVDEVPASREHVVYIHPEWLMVPREIAPEMLRIDVRSPGYVGRLERWTRANAGAVSGLYLSPLSPAAAEYASRAIADLLHRYSFDRIDLHTSPFPDDEFDYSRQAMDLFRGDVRAHLSAAERARMDQIEAIDPFAYPDEFPTDWRLFRRARLDDLVAHVTASVKTVRPSQLAVSDTGQAADTH